MATTASDTSFMPIAIAACENMEPPPRRVLTDELAARMVPTALRPLLRAARVRAMLRAAMDRDAPGIWNSIACRKRAIDDAVAQAIGDSVTRLVVLGAGLDTRAARFAVDPRLRAIELDLPVNIARKRRRLPSDVPVTLTPIDFETDDVARTLGDLECFTTPTTYVWEGVTQYLTEDAVHATLRALDDAPTGSRLVLTYVRADFLDGTDHFDSPGLLRRFVRTGVWRYGLLPSDAAALLADHRWRVIDDAGPDEFAQRYLTPAGRDGASPIERTVCAVKTAR